MPDRLRGVEERRAISADRIGVVSFETRADGIGLPLPRQFAECPRRNLAGLRLLALFWRDVRSPRLPTMLRLLRDPRRYAGGVRGVPWPGLHPDSESRADASAPT